jgi:hypothetical protein
MMMGRRTNSEMSIRRPSNAKERSAAAAALPRVGVFDAAQA